VSVDLHHFDKRFAPDGRAYQKPLLRARDHEIIRWHLLGYKNVEIAARLGVTPTTISITLNSAVAREYIRMLGGVRDCSAVDMSAQLTGLAPRCMEFLRDDVLENENAPIHLRAKTANDLLGLAGFVRPQRIQVSGSIAHITPEDIAEIKKRAALAAAECGLLLESAPIEEAEFQEIKDAANGQSKCESSPIESQAISEEGEALSKTQDNDARRLEGLF